MGAGFTLEIPYNQMMLLVMGLFMFVGATRGWFWEFISSIVLLALFGVWFKPELVAPIIEYISRIISLILAFIQEGGSLDLPKVAARAGAIEMPFDGENPYLLFIIVLVGFVVVSYTTRGGSKDITALSRIVGGLLGLLNAFLVVSLIKEFVVRYVRQSTPALAAAGPPPQVSVTVGGLPQDSQPLFGAAGIIGVLVLVLFISNALGKPIGKK